MIDKKTGQYYNIFGKDITFHLDMLEKDNEIQVLNTKLKKTVQNERVVYVVKYNDINYDGFAFSFSTFSKTLVVFEKQNHKSQQKEMIFHFDDFWIILKNNFEIEIKRVSNSKTIASYYKLSKKLYIDSEGELTQITFINN